MLEGIRSLELFTAYTLAETTELVAFEGGRWLGRGPGNLLGGKDAPSASSRGWVLAAARGWSGHAGSSPLGLLKKKVGWRLRSRRSSLSRRGWAGR